MVTRLAGAVKKESATILFGHPLGLPSQRLPFPMLGKEGLWAPFP
jgi:hypothetical protein